MSRDRQAMQTDHAKRTARIGWFLAAILAVSVACAGVWDYRRTHSVRVTTGLSRDFLGFVKQNYAKDIDAGLTEIAAVYREIFGSDVRYANRGLGATGLYEGEVFVYGFRRPPLWRLLAVGLLYGLATFAAALLTFRFTVRAVGRLTSPRDTSRGKKP